MTVLDAPITTQRGYPHTITTQARARLDAFWAGGSLGDRPALHLTWRDQATPVPTWKGSADPKQRDGDPAWQAQQAHEVLAVHGVAEGVPRLSMVFGSNLTLLPALLGYDYEYTSGTAWVHPAADVYARPVPDFDPAHPLVRILDEGMARAAAVLAGRAGLSPPCMGLDALTTLSLLRGAERLCEDLLDAPERVEAWLAPVTRFWRAMTNHFHGRAAALGCLGSSSWLHTWAPGRFEAVQCDAAVLLSKPMFKRFVVPELTASTACFDYALYHLDGSCQLRFLDQIAAVPGIRGIQWNPTPGENQIDDPRWLDAYRAIRAKGLLLQFNLWESRTVEQIITVTRALGPDGLMFALPEFADEASAQHAVVRITAALGR